MDKRSNATDHDLCHFSFADGRRCRMLRHPDHPGLCPFHSREERQRIESERIGTELAATLTGHFYTATDVNHVLGKVFTALAQDRISIKKARALAYLGQLMLQSISTVKDETKFKYTFESWDHMLKNAIHLPDPLPATANDFADAVFATAQARAASRDHSPNGQHPPANAGAAGPESRGKNTSPSPASRDLNVAACPPSSGGPTFRSASSPNDANASADDIDEHTTEEPAFAGAGPNHRRGS
jgi:hypothetical protein